MKYDEELENLINQNIDKEYGKFQSSLIPNVEIKGVRTPVLRKIAKKFAKNNDFLENIELNCFEKVCVACYYIGLTSKDLKDLNKNLDFILPYIDNWAVCDTFVSSLKLLKGADQEDLALIYKYLKSKNVFTQRFAIVCLLNYFLNAENITEILDKISTLQGNNYYVDMAIAWLVSVAFVTFKSETIKLLSSKKLSKFVQNKSISKICDSYKVLNEDKCLVKAYLI